MRSSVKVLSVVTALTMAVGLSACDKQDIAQPFPGSDSMTSSAEPDSGDSDASPSEDSEDDKDGKDVKDTKSKGGETTKSGSEIQGIKSVTLKDKEIGLTQTCDKVIEDYAAPEYKKTRQSDTVCLFHCTLNFTGDVGFSHKITDSTSLQDKTESKRKADEYGALLVDDLKDDGPEVFDSEDSGSGQVEGWIPMTTVSESTKLKPSSEGTANTVYNRGEAEGMQSGKKYAAYFDIQDLVLK